MNQAEPKTDVNADSADPSDRESSDRPGSHGTAFRHPDRRQTQSYLRELLEANGLRPLRQLGQNFLIDLNLIDLLVRESGVTSKDVVLEVGAGTGGLTTRLANVAARVVSVECDRGFHRLALSQIGAAANVTLLECDVLANKNRMEPRVLDAVAQALRETQADTYHLVANLPFDVAAAVIGNLLLEDLPIRSMTVTSQLEVGERMTAQVGTREYGPLTVLIDQVGHSSILRVLPPSVFWPRPNVTSCFVRIDIDPKRDAQLPELREWRRFVRDLFMHRRKTLRAAIARVPGYKRLKPLLTDLLQSLELASDARAEQLTSDQLRTLFEAVRVVAESSPESPPDDSDGSQ